MSTFEALFEQLLFGDGAWIGLILILAICFLVSYKVKYSGVVFSFVLLFLSIEYYGEISASSNFMWSFVLCLISMVFCGWSTLKDVRG